MLQTVLKAIILKARSKVAYYKLGTSSFPAIQNIKYHTDDITTESMRTKKLLKESVSEEIDASRYTFTQQKHKHLVVTFFQLCRVL